LQKSPGIERNWYSSDRNMMMKASMGAAAPRMGHLRAMSGIATTLAIALLLGGCSSGQDPLTLGSAFESKGSKSKKAKGGAAAKKPQGSETAKAGSGEKRPYPNLSTVPKRPNVTPQERRLVIQEGLLADRSRARHTEATPVWARPKTANIGTGEQAPAGTKVQTVTVAGARLATIRFPAGSARLPPGAAGLMRQIAVIQKRSGAKVIAVGHTSRRRRSADAQKDTKAKNALSLARANAVTLLLARLGVNKGRLEAIGRGDTEPTNPRRPFLNRRVDIFMRR
jgi:flagellar motor protein MotB